jgi:hypothetical protein
MDKFKNEIIEFVKLYNDITIDEEPDITIKKLEDFLKKSKEVIKIIEKINEEKKSHLYILEDFTRSYFK